MEFAKRAVDACVRAMQEGRADEHKAQNILKCKQVDVTPIEPFLKHASSDIRFLAARIVGEKGNVKVLLEAALKEQQTYILVRMLRLLGSRKAEGIEAFEWLLKEDSDSDVKEAAIQMFRRAGKVDQLFPMIFDERDFVVQRIKRYLNEQEQNREASDT